MADIAYVESIEVDDFTKAYFDAALFFSRNIDFDDQAKQLEGLNILPPEFLDEQNDIEEFDLPTHKLFLDDCLQFQTDNGHLFTKDNLRYQDHPKQRAGHDFWLTRNGLGVNFQDNWKRPVADTLNHAARKYKPITLYEGNFRNLTCDELVLTKPRKIIQYGG